MNFLRLLMAQWMKTKRTSFRYLIIFIPILYPLLILWYSSYLKKDYTWIINSYSIFFEIIGIMLPLIISILTTLMVLSEENAGDFRALLIEPFSKIQIYISKLLLLIIISLIDILIATIIFLIGCKLIYPMENINYEIFLLGALLTTLGSLFLYGFYLIISFSYGIGASITLGGIGFLIAALIGGTGLGDRVWYFIPWAWSIRLGNLAGTLMPEFSKFTGISMELMNDYFSKEICKSVPFSLIGFLLITLIGVLWFKKWEGINLNKI